VLHYFLKSRLPTLLVTVFGSWALAQSDATRPALSHRAVVRSAPAVEIPLHVDGNSPTFWINGEFHFTTSTGIPAKARGSNQFTLAREGEVHVEPRAHYPVWIEAAWIDDDGTIYGWYHHEPQGLCPGNGLTAPKIGAAVSYDNGYSYHDLGIVLTSPDPIDCSAQNGFFGSGNGDFSVILDQERRYFYFFFTHYGGDISHQGIAVARLAFEDRKSPAGAVWKYFKGEWSEPGLGGDMTPIFQTRVAWQRADADSFWGPAIHWNTHLQSYVILLNRTCCQPNWPQEGIYFSTNPDLSSPENWVRPERIINAADADVGFYPQVIGLGADETDTVAGEIARLYVHGKSHWEILFSTSDGKDPDPVDPTDPTEEVRASKARAIRSSPAYRPRRLR
jgi:hypothetical protein